LLDAKFCVYCHEGVILFERRAGHTDWEPTSFFAKRIAGNLPGHWFDQLDAKEQEIFATGRKGYEKYFGSTVGKQIDDGTDPLSKTPQ